VDHHHRRISHYLHHCGSDRSEQVQPHDADEIG